MHLRNIPEGMSEEVFHALSSASTATITTQLVKRGFRNTFLEGLFPTNPQNNRMVGEAFTLRSIPSREDLDPLSVYDDYDHPQRVAIEQIQPGQVLVIDSRGETRAASLGHILATRLQVRGAAGIVSDGTFRDFSGIQQLDMPSFSQGASPTTNLMIHHVVDMQLPIGCAGVPVYPKDIIVADGDGVVCIPRHVVEEVALDSVKQDALEDFVLEKIRSGAPLRGTYPPNEKLLNEYKEQNQLGE